MSLYAKAAVAMENKNVDQLMALYHSDYQFVRHQSNSTMNRDQLTEMMKAMFSNEAVVRKNSRCIYEKDDIVVEHMFMDFPDGSSEAVLAVHTLKEGLFFRSETGATALK